MYEKYYIHLQRVRKNAARTVWVDGYWRSPPERIPINIPRWYEDSLFVETELE